MPVRQNLSLSITNPLVLYRALVATGKIRPDPAQHRLALQLQKLYFRLKDYAPEIEYRHRLEKISRDLGRSRVSRRQSGGDAGGKRGTTGNSNGSRSGIDADGTSGATGQSDDLRNADDSGGPRSTVGESGRGHSRAEHDEPSGGGPEARKWTWQSSRLSSLLSRTRTSLSPSTLALTRTTPLHDSAVSIDSPRGMLVYGEVGRGKSMLLDLLFDSLPSRKKRRWHHNTFMLDVFRRIELARLDHLLEQNDVRAGLGLFGTRAGQQHEHVVLRLARDTVSESPILFLDEFQMPDRTAAKLVGGFFTAFFHLGGVLVASSNRMPEELSKAAGVEFGSRQRMGRGAGGGASRSAESGATSGRTGFAGGGPRGGIFGWRWPSQGEMAARSDFGLFLDVLKARCEVWEMEGEKDWRREVDHDYGFNHEDVNGQEVLGEDDGLGSTSESASVTAGADSESVLSGSTATTDSMTTTTTTTTTTVTTNDGLSTDSPPHYHVIVPSSSGLEADLRTLNPSDTWTPTTLTVYARPLHLRTTHDGILKSTFSALCATYLGPADYVSLCSTFHTLIITGVPVLTAAQKNEARRFITLLDALYEARCRLLIEAAAPPDKLFFPETGVRRVADESDSITSEAFSEMYQDSTAPFRPNVSIYTESHGHESELLQHQHQQFTASLHDPSRRSVLADEDADFGPTYGNGRGRGISQSDIEAGRQAGGPDFTETSALTGEDERFAYKRARSRLWEMCGRRWWDERSSVEERSWWRPVDARGRTWESRAASVGDDLGWSSTSRADEGGHGEGEGEDEDEGGHDPQNRLFRHGASPYRTAESPPPTFGSQHAWGMMRWGKKAGRWGKGTDAFVEGDEKRSSDDNNGKRENERRK